MKIIGAILEVNPFHNGHKYFMSEIEKQEDDILICVTSTALCQRGEFSVIDKETKTKLLLENGADIVVALPGVFANQGGQFFAQHAIEILSKFNFDTLYFGSESNNVEELRKYAKNFVQSDFKYGVNANLEMLKSNDILGISYLRAIDYLSLNIDVNLVKRIGNNYNDKNLTFPIASATSIRSNISTADVKSFLPQESYEQIKMIDKDLLNILWNVNLENCLDNDFNVFLSHDNQLLKKLRKYNEFEIDSLVLKASDKNNSSHKLRRVIVNTILNIPQKKYDINYIHILGFSRSASPIIKRMKNDVVFNTLALKDDVALIENRIDNLYFLLTGYKPSYKPIIHEEN